MRYLNQQQAQMYIHTVTACMIINYYWEQTNLVQEQDEVSAIIVGGMLAIDCN